MDLSRDQGMNLLEEMNKQRFDVIRYPAYRVASKLKFIQRRANFHLIDIFNVIESIRENGLHAFQDVSSSIPVTKLKIFVSSIYHQLSKRLPPSQRLNMEESACQLESFLRLNCSPAAVKVSVLSIKVTLAALCSGKLEDKLTYLFSLVSDPSTGILWPLMFNAFVRELLSLAEVVGERDYYQNDPQQVAMIFDLNQQVKLNDFLQVFISPKGTPICFSFLMAFSRMSEVERVVHPVTCEVCRRNGFTGFRYKCQKCYNYNMCQDCFWRGRSSGSHNADTHPCKEFCFWQSQSREISNTLRRSFRCLPSERPIFSIKDQPIKKIDLKNVVPPSPIPRHHQLSYDRIAPEPFSRGSPAYASLPRIHLKGPLESTPIQYQNSVPPADEEHQLIQLYIKKLSAKGHETKKTDSDPSLFEERRKKISQLEARNRQMMEEIARLKKSFAPNMTETRSPGMEPLYTSELTALRYRKDELERHLTALQDSRKELLAQLESLMKLLKNHGNLLISTPSSAASTLNRRSDQHQISSDVAHFHHEPQRGVKQLWNGSDSVFPATSSLNRGFNSATVSDEFMHEFNRSLRLRSEPKY